MGRVYRKHSVLCRVEQLRFTARLERLPTIVTAIGSVARASPQPQAAPSISTRLTRRTEKTTQIPELPISTLPARIRTPFQGSTTFSIVNIMPITAAGFSTIQLG